MIPLQSAHAHISAELLIAIGGVAVTVLTVYGALIKYLYTQTTTMAVTLEGNGDTGFIEETQNAHEDVRRSQREIERTLRAHGALLQEIVYTLDAIAEEMDGDEFDDLDTRRLEHLEQSLRADDDIMESSPDYERRGSDDEDATSD